jgi:hypothetical protein
LNRYYSHYMIVLIDLGLNRPEFDSGFLVIRKLWKDS